MTPQLPLPATPPWVRFGTAGFELGFLGFVELDMYLQGSTRLDNSGLPNSIWLYLDLLRLIVQSRGFFGSMWANCARFGSIWDSWGWLGSLWAPCARFGPPWSDLAPFGFPGLALGFVGSIWLGLGLQGSISASGI